MATARLDIKIYWFAIILVCFLVFPSSQKDVKDSINTY